MSVTPYEDLDWCMFPQQHWMRWKVSILDVSACWRYTEKQTKDNVFQTESTLCFVCTHHYWKNNYIMLHAVINILLQRFTLFSRCVYPKQCTFLGKQGQTVPEDCQWEVQDLAQEPNGDIMPTIIHHHSSSTPTLFITNLLSICSYILLFCLLLHYCLSWISLLFVHWWHKWSLTENWQTVMIHIFLAPVWPAEVAGHPIITLFPALLS